VGSSRASKDYGSVRLKREVKRDGRKDSSWNSFLHRNKDLGLTRAELKAMYRKTIFTARRDATKHHHKHAAPHISSSSTTLHDEVAPEEDDSNDGAYTGFGTKGARGVAGSGSSGAGQLIGDTHAGEQEFGRGRTAWNRFLKTKQGLGLNRAQLKVLYRQQLHVYRSRGNGQGRVESSTLGAAFGGARGGRGSGGASDVGGGATHRGVRNSPWNRFLNANKGLGLKRGQLQELYQRTGSACTHSPLQSPLTKERGVGSKKRDREEGDGGGIRLVKPKVYASVPAASTADKSRKRFTRDQRGRWVCVQNAGESSTKTPCLPGKLTLGARVSINILSGTSGEGGSAISKNLLNNTGWISTIDKETNKVYIRSEGGATFVALAAKLTQLLVSGTLSITALPLAAGGGHSGGRGGGASGGLGRGRARGRGTLRASPRSERVGGGEVEGSDECVFRGGEEKDVLDTGGAHVGGVTGGASTSTASAQGLATLFDPA